MRTPRLQFWKRPRTWGAAATGVLLIALSQVLDVVDLPGWWAMGGAVLAGILWLATELLAERLREHRAIGDGFAEPDQGPRGRHRTLGPSPGGPTAWTEPTPPRYFTGRDQELTAIDELMRTPREPAVVVVHGTAGVGKTTLIAGYAANARQAGRKVLWVPAENPDVVLRHLVRAIHSEWPDAPTTALFTATSVDWLRTRDDWIMVLDNVHDHAVVRRMTEALRTGRFIVTTQHATGWTNWETLALGELEETAAADLFLRVSNRHEPADLDHARLLVTEQGALPLALENMGSYVASSGRTIESYRTELRRNPQRMLSKTVKGTPKERTLLRIWTVTLDKVVEESALALPILHVIAHWVSEDIPEWLLWGLDRPWRRSNRDMSEDPRAAIADAIDILAAYSLITLDPVRTSRNARVFTVHRFLQTVLKVDDKTDPHRRPADLRRAIEVQADLLDDAREALRNAQVDPADVEFVFLSAARSPVTIARMEQVAAKIKRDKNTGGPTSERYLAALSDLAYVYRSANELTEAADLYWEVANARERRPDPNPDATIKAWKNLAWTYMLGGQVDDAIRAYYKITAHLRGLSDPDPGMVIEARVLLASALEHAGRMDQAVTLRREVVGLADSYYPGTWVPRSARRTYAACLTKAGRSAEAVTICTEAVSATTRARGKHHPETFEVRADLGETYWRAGRLDDARDELSEVDELARRILPGDHPLLGRVCRILAAIDEPAQVGDSVEAGESARAAG
jgi:tetratricopeptide (TPR) repeat protein